MTPDSRVFIAGRGGLAGSAIARALHARGFGDLLGPRRTELDLRNQAAVDNFFSRQQPQYVILAAATVGGIYANSTHPADFIRDNLQIQTNVIDAAFRHGVRKLCFLGSSCVYPRLAQQPMNESSLMTGPLEPSNECYAVAKIAGITMCQAYAKQFGFNAISVMPTNLYGPGDNFDLDRSHVLPALIRKFHEAKRAGAETVTVWGTGTPRREFLYVDDLADAVYFLMQNYDSPDIINIGVGDDVTIAALAELVREVTGFRGSIMFDTGKPDGTPRKLLDVTKLRALGWQAQTPLADGIRTTYDWYLENSRNEGTA
jgi:GDP-L-fucose synthase